MKRELKHTKPIISVIIPAYNTAKYVRAALDSVLNQTYTNLQVIVIDDASTDGTAEILDSYTDSRLEIIHFQENRGVCAARNEGLKRANGDYIAFHDSDDVWALEKLEKQIAFLEREPEYGACFTWAVIIDENGELRELSDEDVRWHYSTFHSENRDHAAWLMRMLHGGNLFPLPSVLMRRTVARQVGLQNLSLLQLQDFEYWVRLLSISNVYIIPEELLKYRRISDGNSISASNETTCARSYNEGVFVCTHFFDYISDELFIKLFQSEFRCADSASPEELACEKSFLLSKAYCGSEPFLHCVQRLMCDEKTAGILRERFHFSANDFYEANAKRRYIDYTYVRQQQEDLQEKYQAISNAFFWRVTKPLRVLLDASKRVPFLYALDKKLRDWRKRSQGNIE